MTKKADTWMPWYVGDYVSATTHLSTERHGAYCLMLMTAWKRGGSLPKDDAQLCEITKMTPAKWRASRAVLLEFFQDDGTSYVHKRVTSERIKAQAISDKKAEAGSKGGKAKQLNASKSGSTDLADATANAKQSGQQTGTPSPSPSHSPSGNSEANASGGKPPKLTDPKEIIFGYGLALLVSAGVPEKQARSFLGGRVKEYDEAPVIDALRSCAQAKPLQPLEWLAAALPPGGKKDIAPVTTAADPKAGDALKKITADAAMAAPITPAIRAQISEALKGKVH